MRRNTGGHIAPHMSRVSMCVCVLGWGGGHREMCSHAVECILLINAVIRKQPIKMSPASLIAILQAGCLLFTVAFCGIPAQAKLQHLQPFHFMYGNFITTLASRGVDESIA